MILLILVVLLTGIILQCKTRCVFLANQAKPSDGWLSLPPAIKPKALEWEQREEGGVGWGERIPWKTNHSTLILLVDCKGF